MTPEGERLVRETWKQFEPMTADHEPAFNEALMALDPDALAAFEHAGDNVPGRPVLMTFGPLIASIDEPERFVRTLVELGRRYAERGVRLADYEAAGAALLRTLEEALGPALTPEAREAWREACHAMTSVLRRVAPDTD